MSGSVGSEEKSGEEKERKWEGKKLINGTQNMEGILIFQRAS